jgi:hypothetical protein
MSTPAVPWSALINAIRELRPAVRVNWSGDAEPTQWEPWLIQSSRSYLETGSLGPVPFDEVEWLEIDASRKNERGRLVAFDQRQAIAAALTDASVPFETVGGSLRITGHAG